MAVGLRRHPLRGRFTTTLSAGRGSRQPRDTIDARVRLAVAAGRLESFRGGNRMDDIRIDSPEELKEGLRNSEGPVDNLKLEALIGIYRELQRIADALEKKGA